MHYTTKLGLPAPDDADPLGSLAQAVSDLADAIDGTLPRVQAGRRACTVPAVNTTYSARVNFAQAFSSTPVVVVNAEVTPATTASCSARNVDTTGFDLVWQRSAGGDMSVTWIASRATQ